MSTPSKPTATDDTKSPWPTRKWWAALVTGLGALIILWINQGREVTDAVLIALVSLVVERIVAYMIPNKDTPGGVPLRSGAR